MSDTRGLDRWIQHDPRDDHRLKFDTGKSQDYRTCPHHGWALHTVWTGEGGQTVACEECQGPKDSDPSWAEGRADNN